MTCLTVGCYPFLFRTCSPDVWRRLEQQSCLRFAARVNIARNLGERQPDASNGLFTDTERRVFALRCINVDVVARVLLNTRYDYDYYARVR